MNNIVAVRKCKDYDFQEVYKHISDIYRTCKGPELKNKKVLLKPNILSDSAPEKCISTHPVVVEAMIRYLQAEGADVVTGDSPAVHLRGFRPEKSGISAVCEKTGTKWINFLNSSSGIKLKNGNIRIASVTREVDLIISLPKLKNHELVYFTGAIKNTLGLVPGFSKARQHALHQNRESFSRFLVDLNETLTPHFFLLDGIIGMEGHGPGQGTPFRTEVLIGSSNPLALDIQASIIAGYDPKDIPTNRIALARGIWLHSADEIIYDGPALKTLVKKDFKRIPVTANTNISIKFLKYRIQFLRKLDRRPVFIHDKCTSCRECIKICPQNAIAMHPAKDNYVVLTDKKCIRCFCCSEVCKYNAIKIRVKPFGV
jgi:uncharacterized protein (DUF362 family)/Pyruvate/2-oxoacid:ferredoxin oxidoreductase delta subunit